MWALAVLPKNGRVAGSFEYLAKDAFGLNFLGDIYAAAYDLDGGRVKLFIHRAADQASARALLEEYRVYFEEHGETVWANPEDAPRIVAGRAFGVIDVVFAKGIYLGGVAGADDLETAKKAAVAFHEDLTAP
jgi:hypothetical protein